MPEKFEDKGSSKYEPVNFGDYVTTGSESPSQQAKEGFVSEYLSSAGNYIKENPVTSAAIGTVVIGGLALAMRSRMAGRLAPYADDALRQGAGEGTSLASALGIKEAGAITESAILQAGETAGTKAARLAGQVEFSGVNKGLLRAHDGSAIPDIVRESMPASSLALSADLVERASSQYRGALPKLWSLPRNVETSAGQSLHGIATEALSARAAVTGEAVTAEAISKELSSLHALNPAIADGHALLKEGTNIAIYDAARLEKVSGDLRFRFVPQIGEFLGISKEAQAHCLAIQAQDKSVKIGQIFVNERLAEEQAVEQAFKTQSAWKQRMADDLTRYMQTAPK